MPPRPTSREPRAYLADVFDAYHVACVQSKVERPQHLAARLLRLALEHARGGEVGDPGYVPTRPRGDQRVDRLIRVTEQHQASAKVSGHLLGRRRLK